MNVSAGTVARTIILALALINQILHTLGIASLPIEDETITAVVTGLFTVAAAVMTWWKNQSFTKHALVGDAAMKESKEK